MHTTASSATHQRHGRPAAWRALNGAGRTAVVLVVLGLACHAAAQTTSPFAGDNSRVRGDAHAPLTLLEYSDFTCGYCEKFFKETWPILFSDYVQTGKIRMVYRDYPRSPDGPSVDTALAARCAGEQGQYWAMHDRLFAGRSKFTPAQLHQQAEVLQLDTQRFDACFEESRYTKDIFADRFEAGNLGIRGTPAFVLYVTKSPKDAIMIPGAFPFEVFKEEIDKMLRVASAARPSPTVDDGGGANGRAPSDAATSSPPPGRSPI